jgi:hypothetical protein
MILLGAFLWPNPSEPQHPDVDVELLCTVCKFPHLHEKIKETSGHYALTLLMT